MENKRNPDEMITDENGNVIIRGTDGKDHMIRPDLMKVLLISRGPKLNRRERRENWIKKRTILPRGGQTSGHPKAAAGSAADGKPQVCLWIASARHILLRVCLLLPRSPGNYQFFLMQPGVGTKLSLKVGKFEVAKIVGEERPARFWTKTLEKEIQGKICRMFEGFHMAADRW